MASGSVDTSPGNIANFPGNPILWYNTPTWGPLGFAIANPGKAAVSCNSVILNLVSVIGRNLQAVMVHPDANLRTPPSINTLTRIHKLIGRVRSIVAGRAVPPGTPNLEPEHDQPDEEPFLMFPCPYFEVRNAWMKEYSGLVLGALSELMQNNENAKPFEISTSLGSLLGGYLNRVYRLVATELIGIDAKTAADPAFYMTPAQLSAYDPTQWFTSTELIDTVPNMGNWPSAYDLGILAQGIPVSQLPATIGPFPFGASPPPSGQAQGTNSTGAAAPAAAAPPAFPNTSAAASSPPAFPAATGP